MHYQLRAQAGWAQGNASDGVGPHGRAPGGRLALRRGGFFQTAGCRGVLKLACVARPLRTVTSNMRMAFDLRDAIPFEESTVIGFDGLATDDAIDGLGFPEEHLRP